MDGHINYNFIPKIRKPPGGDTSDIFNTGFQKNFLNKNVQSFVNEIQSNCPYTEPNISENGDEKCLNVQELTQGSGKEVSTQYSCNQEDSESDNEVICFSDGFDVEKENVKSGKEDGNHEDDQIILKKLISLNGDKVTKGKNENIKSKKFATFNPITGEMCEVDGHCRSTLGDCSNAVLPVRDVYSQNTADFGLSRPSIRIRHPPGGASSNIF